MAWQINYTVNVGAQEINFANAYAHATSPVVTNPTSGTPCLQYTVWDSATSFENNVMPIGSVQIPITITPTLLSALLTALVSDPENQPAAAFFANAIAVT